MKLTVKVGLGTEAEEDASASAELASSARTTAAASATVAPIANRIVLACCLEKNRGVEGSGGRGRLSNKKVGALL